MDRLMRLGRQDKETPASKYVFICFRIMFRIILDDFCSYGFSHLLTSTLRNLHPVHEVAQLVERLSWAIPKCHGQVAAHACIYLVPCLFRRA